ncbi:hypothetical protein PQR05_28265 [Paraburkholderia sediminicola]|uniref:Lipoprotein n=1 Tax=Paraburkholderia metrosideri TaxID=580937 RepID=A0ABW9DKE7_9BURK
MKSRVIDSLCTISQRLPRGLPRLSRTGIALAGAACMLTLSGCYYPYGYYPGYYPYYAYGTVPPTDVQREVAVGTAGDSATSQQQQAQAAQQARANAQSQPPSYAVAQPPVYVAPPYPAYPAYYPPPVYPAYYGYPGWYGPSVSIGFGFGGYWGGGRGGWGGHGHYH